MTGFPGFLATELLGKILARAEGGAICVVQPKYLGHAERRAAQLAEQDPRLSGRIRIVAGDITEPRLGIDDVDALVSDIKQVWHLAAAYDLAVPRDVGMRVNVDGTRHALRLAADCPRLERFHYFSTCYVSGRYTGPFAEDDLDVGARFNNFYEETKHLAEAEVRARMAQGLPATIYRPSIVLGDSRTGETQKYDGLYFAIRLLLRQPRLAALPVFGDASAYRANIVPRDFVTDAVEHLSGLPQSLGRTYHLADPHPQTVDEWYDTLGEATGRTIVRIPMPEQLTRAAVGKIPGAEELLGIPAELLDYFVHPTHYLTEHTRADLAGTGIACPPFSSYAANIVGFMRAHPDISSLAMI